MPKFLSVKTFKKFTALTLIASLLLNPIAFATSSYIELDFQESEAADRLHTIMPLSNVRDISHIEIDSDEQRVRVYRDTETAEDNSEPETSSVSAHESVLDLSRRNIYNLPWQLGQEGLVCFLSQHTAWLTPLGDDDYRLEFTGRLLGGMWWGDSSDDSGGYSNDYDSGSYSSDSRQCPSNFNIDSDGCARGSDGRTIPVFNITESTVVENSNSGSSDTRGIDYGRSYGKNSDGGSSSSDYGYTNNSSTNHQSRPTPSKPAAPRPTADLSKLYARLNIKPPAKPAPKPAVLKLPAHLTAKPVAKPTVPNILAQLNIKPAAKPVAKPAPKVDLSKLLAVAKPPAKPAPVAKPAPKADLSKLLAVAKPAAKPAPKPIVIHPLIQQVKYRVNNQDPMSPHDFFDLEGKMGGAAMGGGKLNWNRALGTKNQPSASQPARIVNPPKAESPVWKDFKYYSKDTKTNGLQGSKKEYYQWDHTHNDIEAYDHKFNHLGSMDPKTGKIYKPAVKPRKIDI